jgi:SPP1 family predicted phage head-tail adaptor
MPLRRLSAGLPRPDQYTPIGAMNRQVTFYSPGVRSATDGTTGAPQAAFSTWAALYAIAGVEIEKAQQIAQKVSHLVVIPYQLGVEENMTIQYLDNGATRIFQIEAVDDPDELRVQLKIYCFEIGQNAGAGS